jgi:hypothetical protein
MKSPKHWMPIVGGFIVFFTFIVKEGLMEHWKETADAIDRANTAYKTQKELDELDRSIKEILDYTTGRIKTGATSLNDTEARLSADQSFETYLEATHEEMKLLLEKMPENKADAATLAGLKSDTEKAKVLVRKMGALEFDSIVFGSDATKLQVIKKEHSQTQGEAEIALKDDTDRMDRFVQQELTKAESVHQRNGLYARWAWWISAFLFAVGWGLGLVGKLYGVPEAGGVD